MAEQRLVSQETSEGFPRWSAVAFAIGFAIHGVDHIAIRGMSASPMAVMIGGNIQGVLIVIAMVMVFTRRYRAPEAAIAVGFGSAALFTYAHLLPGMPPDFSDSFVSPPAIGVTWFSWLSAFTEIGTGLVFGAVGIRARRARPVLAAGYAGA